MNTDLDHSSAYLYGCLAVVEARVEAAVARRRAVDPDPEDRFRGLYISDAHVDELLATPKTPAPSAADPAILAHRSALEAQADAAESAGAEVRLRRLARSFGLDDPDVEILLIALAPDLDPRFERLYGYLHDDVSRRRASTGLALELCQGRSSVGAERSRFNEDCPLLADGLLLVEEPDRPFLTRSLRVPDRITAHLLGDDTPESLVAPLLTAPVVLESAESEILGRALAAGHRLVYAREHAGAAGISFAAAATEVANLPSVALDLTRLDPNDDLSGLMATAAREAQLAGGVLIAGPIETIAERGPAAVREFAEARVPVILIGSRSWDPTWSREIPLLVDAPTPSLVQRRAIWHSALEGQLLDGVDPAPATAAFRLTPEQSLRAARAASQQSALQGRACTVADLHAGARAQNAAGLERLARRIEPRVGWDDLVLPRDSLDQLRELTARARHRELVLETWAMGARSTRGRGVTALFAGESGTGKTLSAEVVAADLGLDLYVIDLSTVIDKYIGETEKNLERIFVEADRVNGVLLFDEADAIFGKRSEVKDAHDRYANVETAYLLQRMERFDGLAILTTNLRANVDEAFTRRLDVIVDFPMPEADDRRQLWELNLRRGLPLAADFDIDFLAASFKLSGGNIRNIVFTAAYLAADDGRVVNMAHLVRATEREYRKLGRLCVPDEFGAYYSLLG